MTLLSLQPLPLAPLDALRASLLKLPQPSHRAEVLSQRCDECEGVLAECGCQIGREETRR